jgi:hypothetical protein
MVGAIRPCTHGPSGRGVSGGAASSMRGHRFRNAGTCGRDGEYRARLARSVSQRSHRLAWSYDYKSYRRPWTLQEVERFGIRNPLSVREPTAGMTKRRALTVSATRQSSLIRARGGDEEENDSRMPGRPLIAVRLRPQLRRPPRPRRPRSPIAPAVHRGDRRSAGVVTKAPSASGRAPSP